MREGHTHAERVWIQSLFSGLWKVEREGGQKREMKGKREKPQIPLQKRDGMREREHRLDEAEDLLALVEGKE